MDRLTPLADVRPYKVRKLLRPSTYVLADPNIEVWPPDPSRSAMWLTRKIISQQATGAVRLQRSNGKHEDVVDLAIHKWRWRQGRPHRQAVAQAAGDVQDPRHPHSCWASSGACATVWRKLL